MPLPVPMPMSMENSEHNITYEEEEEEQGEMVAEMEEEKEEQEELEMEALEIEFKDNVVPFAKKSDEDLWHCIGIGFLTIRFNLEFGAYNIMVRRNLDEGVPEPYTSNIILSMDTLIEVIIVFVYTF